MDPQRLLRILKSCIAMKSKARGEILHSKAITLGFQDYTPVSKMLMDFYISFHLLDSALLVLPSVEDISLWNCLLSGYSKNRFYSQALYVFDRLLRDLRPDIYTYPSALKACGGLGNVIAGERIHCCVVKSGFLFDVVVSSSIVGMYAKCKMFASAIQLFDEMPERDVVCWNTVISCYHQDGQASKALEVYETMRSCGFEPDSVTFATVFSACARVLDLERGGRMHEELIRKRVELDEFVGSAIVDMYGKCGCLDRAREVFEGIQTKNVVSWNTMIGGYSLKGDTHSCLQLFSRMNRERIRPSSTTISNLLTACSKTCDLRHGKFIHGCLIRKHISFDVFIGSSLIDLYFKCASIRYAESVFEMMPKEDVVSWNVMISGYATTGSYFKALDLLHEMRINNVRPDAVTFTGVLSACAQLSALELGKEIHHRIKADGLESNEIVMSALLDMYAKCGGVREAQMVFHKLQVKDIVSWTSMVVAYGSHGQASKALKLFEDMLKESRARPDRVMFLAVLSACNHGGLVEEGCHYFKQMTDVYGIKPAIEHYSCMIDLLGRSGRLQEAYFLLRNMPDIEADAGLLGSLFSACSLHKNLELGERVAALLIEINPDDHSTYVVLGNMYASAGKWDKVRKVRAEMKERGLRKNPGCSWIEIDKKIHQFFAEDDSHQQAEVIYECLQNLSVHMKKKKRFSKPVTV
ncbi:hypothetical protein J5N97_018828 [Dioscorea zingiberensis]|uniref:Pentatricopeptide repeat-containing protein n=1 Tax=Dioscorea zingiberensis TaxID=325984 RepID=A0A9D5CDD0_9LILI|nr:hypothetical protein J5N97_018828 [Dioscorea zingiberensis]